MHSACNNYISFRKRLSVQLDLYVLIYFISICVQLFDIHNLFQLFDIDIDCPFSGGC